MGIMTNHSPIPQITLPHGSVVISQEGNLFDNFYEQELALCAS
jgi:hypothetical protein